MEQKNIYSREKSTIEIKFNGQPKKLIKETLFLDGIPRLTRYREEDDFFQQYAHCYNCDNWVDFHQSRIVFYPNKSACLECYPTIIKDLETRRQYHVSIVSDYLEELLFENTRMVLNSNYQTDRAFFNSYESCFLTGRQWTPDAVEIHRDHFIARNTGHVGGVIGNVLPMYYKLNMSKSNKNPFEWINERDVRNAVSADRWDELINYFAHCYGLTLNEYKNFVYWCYGNPRKIKDIKKDEDHTSLELWRKSQ